MGDSVAGHLYRKGKRIEENKIATSEETVRNWQDTNQVSFPDLSPDHIAEVRERSHTGLPDFLHQIHC
jgi:hypothetical protein